MISSPGAQKLPLKPPGRRTQPPRLKIKPPTAGNGSSCAIGVRSPRVCVVSRRSWGTEVGGFAQGWGLGVGLAGGLRTVGKFTATSRVVKGKIDKTDTRRAECGLGTAIQAHCSDHVPATLMALTASRAERTRTVTAAAGFLRCRRRRRASVAI